MFNLSSLLLGLDGTPTLSRIDRTKDGLLKSRFEISEIVSPPRKLEHASAISPSLAGRPRKPALRFLVYSFLSSYSSMIFCRRVVLYEIFRISHASFLVIGFSVFSVPWREVLEGLRRAFTFSMFFAVRFSYSFFFTLFIF